jgi:hypothetical protein
MSDYLREVNELIHLLETVDRQIPPERVAERVRELLRRRGLADDDEVIVEGRRYRIVINAPNCVSVQHQHEEPHADGSDGSGNHHHHVDRCQDMPRQATLYPLEKRHTHAHQFSGDDQREDCPCGAWRTVLPWPKRYRGKGRLLQYHMPPDPMHPRGWSYERKETEWTARADGG